MNENLRYKFKTLLTWFLNPKDNFNSYASENEPYLIDQFADLLIAIHSSINSYNFKKNNKVEINVPLIDWSTYHESDLDYLKPLHQLHDYVNSCMNCFVRNFFLHGSFASNDYIKGWSDVDTLVVINNSTFDSSVNLKKFREHCINADMFLYQVDPLKHHGLIYCTELDLNYYSEIIMPVSVIQRSVSLLADKSNFTCFINNKKIISKNTFNSRVKTFVEAADTGVFRHHAKDGEYLKSNIHDHNNVMYQLKYFLGLIMTMPAYFLECRGTPCYKADSFDKVRDLISDESWEIIVACSKIRSDWSKMEQHPFSHQNNVPNWVKSYLGEDYLNRAKNLVLELENNL